MSELTVIESDLRNVLGSAMSWLTQGLEQHLPKLASAAAEADAAAADPLAVAAAAVPGKYRPMAAKLLTDLAALDGTAQDALQAAERVSAASDVPVQATTPADPQPPADVTAEPAAQPA